MKKSTTYEELEKNFPESVRLSKIIAEAEDKGEDIYAKADLARPKTPKSA